MERFSVIVPIEKKDFMTVVRLTSGGICAVADLTLDEMEDFKVCVTESLLILSKNGFKSARIDFDVSDAITATITGENGEDIAERGDEMSYMLLSALISKVEYAKENGVVTKIVLDTL